MVGVGTNVTVEVGQRVCVGVIVGVLVGVLDGVNVWVGVGVIDGTGGSPITVKKPDTIHSEPTNICTS